MRKEERGEEGEGEKARGFRNFFFFFFGFFVQRPTYSETNCQLQTCRLAPRRRNINTPGGTKTRGRQLFNYLSYILMLNKQHNKTGT